MIFWILNLGIFDLVGVAQDVVKMRWMKSWFLLLSRSRFTRMRRRGFHIPQCAFSKMMSNGLGGKRFQVNWEGGHSSSFPLDWLKERSFREEARALYREKVRVSGTCHILKELGPSESPWSPDPANFWGFPPNFALYFETILLIFSQ